MLAGGNIDDFSCLNHLEEKTLANGLQIKYKYSVNVREKTLVIGQQFDVFRQAVSIFYRLDDDCGLD